MVVLLIKLNDFRLTKTAFFKLFFLLTLSKHQVRLEKTCRNSYSNNIRNLFARSTKKSSLKNYLKTNKFVQKLPLHLWKSVFRTSTKKKIHQRSKINWKFWNFSGKFSFVQNVNTETWKTVFTLSTKIYSHKVFAKIFFLPRWKQFWESTSRKPLPQSKKKFSRFF